MTTRGGSLPLVGLVAIALVTALAVVGVSVYADGDDAREHRRRVPDDGRPGRGGAAVRRASRSRGIEARGSVEPRNILFGDTIRAHVDVVLDRRKVDPGSVRVSTQFVPWEIVGPQVRTRSDSGSNTHLRTTFTLRCTSSPCLPNNNASALEFGPARVSYARAGRRARGAAVAARSTGLCSSSPRGSRRRTRKGQTRRARSGAPISPRFPPRPTESRRRS